MAKDDAESVKWYRKAAEQGYAHAQTNLGMAYLNGVGVAKSDQEAAKWFQKAAMQGDVRAMTNMGVCYFLGAGVAKDEVEAYAYLNLAGVTDEQARKGLGLLEKVISPEARLWGQKRTKELQKEIECHLGIIKDLRKAAEREMTRKGA